MSRHEAASARSYDAIAARYEEAFADEFSGLFIERALLRAFGELVSPGGVVADVGCGTGEVSRFLRDLGIATIGVDVSAGMLSRARLADPRARLAVGSMSALPFADNAIDGIVAHYSIIHLADDELPAAFSGFARVLAPGAPVLLAFQDGDRVRHLDEAFGCPVDLDFRFRSPKTVSALLRDAGLSVVAVVRRAAQPAETGPRAVILATANEVS